MESVLRNLHIKVRPHPHCPSRPSSRHLRLLQIPCPPSFGPTGSSLLLLIAPRPLPSTKFSTLISITSTPPSRAHLASSPPQPFPPSSSTLLISRHRWQSEPLRVVDHFRYARFCLLVHMCFGDKLEENRIREIETIQRGMLLRGRRVDLFSLCPGLWKLLFSKHFEEALQLREDQEGIMLPYIKDRQRPKQQGRSKPQEDDIHPGSSSFSNDYVLSYVDTLLDLQLPEGEEGKRKLSEGEMVSLCLEFLNAGTDTTSTSLQWIMANLVKHPHIQAKLLEEISGVVGEGGEEVKEDDLQKMPYLKAVTLEGLRRHPPSHFLLPHSVSQDATLDGFAIPKNTPVMFMVAEMGWNPKIWEDPKAYKPEGFMKSQANGVEAFDVTGRKEIKMIPFGAGRRICPGYELGILHLE